MKATRSVFARCSNKLRSRPRFQRPTSTVSKEGQQQLHCGPSFNLAKTVPFVAACLPSEMQSLLIEDSSSGLSVNFKVLAAGRLPATWAETGFGYVMIIHTAPGRITVDGTVLHFDTAVAALLGSQGMDLADGLHRGGRRLQDSSSAGQVSCSGGCGALDAAPALDWSDTVFGIPFLHTTDVSLSIDPSLYLEHYGNTTAEACFTISQSNQLCCQIGGDGSNFQEDCSADYANHIAATLATSVQLCSSGDHGIKFSIVFDALNLGM